GRREDGHPPSSPLRTQGPITTAENCFALNWPRALFIGHGVWVATRKPSEPASPERVISAAGIMFAAIHRNNPGAGAFRGVSHWSNSDGCESDTTWCGGGRECLYFRAAEAGQRSCRRDQHPGAA